MRRLSTLELDCRFRHDPDGERLPEGQGMVTAALEGQIVGVLRWDYLAEPPTVVDVDVLPEHRRQGVATALWAEAKKHESGLKHSIALTDAGRGWVCSLSA